MVVVLGGRNGVGSSCAAWGAGGDVRGDSQPFAWRVGLSHLPPDTVLLHSYCLVTELAGRLN